MPEADGVGATAQPWGKGNIVTHLRQAARPHRPLQPRARHAPQFPSLLPKGVCVCVQYVCVHYRVSMCVWMCVSV